MKEVKLKIGIIWLSVTAIVTTAMLCGTTIYVTQQYNQTQKDIANSQAQSMQDSASKIENGLNDIGRGLCKAGNQSVLVC